MVQSTKGAVVITGTSTGLGRVTALLLDKQGYHVFAGVRTEKDAESLKQAASGDLTPIIMDVTKPEQIQSALEFVSLAVGDEGLFGLVNNAVVAVSGPWECIAIDDLRWQFEVGVFGLIAVTQAFLPMIRKAKGRIINISAIGGRLASPFFGPLVASKFALEAITDSMRMELHSSEVEVLSILASSLNTEVSEKVEVIYQKTLDNMSLETKAIYGNFYRKFMEAVVEGNRQGMPPEKVADVILETLEARKPKRQYVITESKWNITIGALKKRLMSHEYFYDYYYSRLKESLGIDE
ncbi:SDR family NAD(P)-dependent oxidoreductase (plasmid) [Nostoc sp. UHCC 0926]|uniref:SDR family NAD(P)-dependent oxidoreductase n=1 Tax=Nostoc sp. UHCC 0926 TaxID=3025190 RepID=UPI002361C861|nr:SDR family NAD(P)-dependent oxidoreductase [Nostoc sp. UHCC 0926]WDD36962.1 SDR family NAD(P)-dependent oxidoreductase [Nostoc sp. UHCC 0926]